MQNASTEDLKAIRAWLVAAVEEIDRVTAGAHAPARVFDVDLGRVVELQSQMRNRMRLTDLGDVSMTEMMAVAQMLRQKGWVCMQRRIDGVKARYWFAPDDPIAQQVKAGGAA